MHRVSLVTGHAGTGKTTWLMNKANDYYSLNGNQRILVLARMHGARRRLQAKLRDHGLYEYCSIATIDGFALSLVNRWRTALGYARPLVSGRSNTSTIETELGIEVSFDAVLHLARKLLESKTIGSIVGSRFPVVIVDEFQDCAGPMLRVVAALSPYCGLLLAADDFQDLSAPATCSAIEWVQGLCEDKVAILQDLAHCHRASSEGLLAAARCLRNGSPSGVPTVPVVRCPQAGPAAWKIIEKLVCSNADQRWRGTCALICPGYDPMLQKVLASCESQLQKRNHKPIQWQIEVASDLERKALFETLALTENSLACSNEWIADGWDHNETARYVVTRVRQFVKLRGLSYIPHSLVAKNAERVLHERRAYSVASCSRVVTTVYWAKNREFDNVFVLWTYKLPPDLEQQRRWLYNAITRSRANCMVLVIGNEARAEKDPVLRLLGPSEPAFARKKPAK